MADDFLVGDIVTADRLNELDQGDSFSAFTTTAVSPLVTGAGNEAVILTVDANFKAGFAYEVSWVWFAQFNSGTSPFMAVSKIRRNNTSGTEIVTTNGTTILTTNVGRVEGSEILKCTVADTTQTIALVGSYSTTGTPTSMNLSALSNRRCRLVVKVIGLASDYSGAAEVPTA